LANTKSALKRIRSSEKRRLRNRRVRTETRTYIKNARTLINAGELDEAQKSVTEAVRALDKAAQKGIIHKNNAARRKSRLLSKLNKATESKSA
jgi:small subunit ribosomal protein S20